MKRKERTSTPTSPRMILWSVIDFPLLGPDYNQPIRCYNLQRYRVQLSCSSDLLWIAYLRRIGDRGTNRAINAFIPTTHPLIG